MTSQVGGADQSVKTGHNCKQICKEQTEPKRGLASNVPKVLFKCWNSEPTKLRLQQIIIQLWCAKHFVQVFQPAADRTQVCVRKIRRESKMCLAEGKIASDHVLRFKKHQFTTLRSSKIVYKAAKIRFCRDLMSPAQIHRWFIKDCGDWYALHKNWFA